MPPALTPVPLRRIRILGYDVLNEPLGRLASYVRECLDSGPAGSYVFLNPHTVVLAERDPSLRQAIEQTSAVVCDGVGLSMASLVLNRRRVHRIYGGDFFTALSRELSEHESGRVFFLGGHPEALPELIAKYRKDYPGIAQVGGYAPAFRPEFTDADIQEMARQIDAAGCDVLWIGLGSPKQEKVLPRIMRCSNVKCAAAIGAVFDFYTNRVPHAPRWIRRLGLQWAHRLVMEPTRLWRRTVISGPLFISHVLRQLAHSPRT